MENINIFCQRANPNLNTMDELDNTYRRLIRCPFEELEQAILEADDGGTYTFSRMNLEKVWRVSTDFHYLVYEYDWTVEEFNAELHRRYK